MPHCLKKKKLKIITNSPYDNIYTIKYIKFNIKNKIDFFYFTLNEETNFV
jgi:hypothetical protein